MKLEVGTLKKIGAQVGDVVEEAGGGLTCKVLENKCLLVTHDDGYSQILERGWYWNCGVWRIVSRASDYDPSPEELRDAAAAKDVEWPEQPSPVRTRTVTEIVPGVYGKVKVNHHAGDIVQLQFQGSQLTSSVKFTRAELIAARDILSQLIDAMPP